MNSTRIGLLGTAIVALNLVISTAHAGTWVEVGDAGESLASAQSTTGAGPLDTITGNLIIDYDHNRLWDVDMYCIEITNPVTGFSATLSPTSDQTQFNPLFLFDRLGFGVTEEEGFYNWPNPSMITGQFIPAAGTYYLAIGMHDVSAGDAQGNELWDPFVVGTGAESQPINTNPLGQWMGNGRLFYDPDGAYSIELTGASYGNCSQSTPTDRTSWGKIKARYR